MSEHEVMTTAEVAILLRVSTKTVLVLANSGALPGEKVGRAWRFIRNDVINVVRGGDGERRMEESLNV